MAYEICGEAITSAQRKLLKQIPAGVDVADLDGREKFTCKTLAERAIISTEGTTLVLTDKGKAILAKIEGNGAGTHPEADTKPVRHAKPKGNGAVKPKKAPTNGKPTHAGHRGDFVDTTVAALAALDAEYQEKRKAVELAAPYFTGR